MLAIRLYTAGKSGQPAYRRGIPARPRKCIGKKVKFTPKNITKNWALRRIGFIDRPVNKEISLQYLLREQKLLPFSRHNGNVPPHNMCHEGRYQEKNLLKQFQSTHLM